MRVVGEDVRAEGLALGGGHAGFSNFHFRFSIWRGGGAGRRREHFGLCGLSLFFFRGPGPVELNAEEAAGFGLGSAWAVDAADFCQEGGEIREAVGDGVGFGEGGEGGEFVDGGDAHFAQAWGEGDLAGAEEGAGPEADGLAFFSGLDEFDEMAFEQKHGGKISRGGEWRKSNGETTEWNDQNSNDE